MILQTAHIRPLSRSNPEVQLLMDASLDEKRRENLSPARDPSSDLRSWDERLVASRVVVTVIRGWWFRNLANSPVDMVVYPMIHRVSCMLGGAGFLPSTVSLGIKCNQEIQRIPETEGTQQFWCFMSEIVGGFLSLFFFATVLAQMPKLAVKTKPTLTHTELGGWKKRVLSASCERFHWKFKTCRGAIWNPRILKITGQHIHM